MKFLIETYIQPSKLLLGNVMDLLLILTENLNCSHQLKIAGGLRIRKVSGTTKYSDRRAAGVVYLQLWVLLLLIEILQCNIPY